MVEVVVSRVDDRDKSQLLATNSDASKDLNCPALYGVHQRISIAWSATDLEG
jgi:hypothetical protein